MIDVEKFSIFFSLFHLIPHLMSHWANNLTNFPSCHVFFLFLFPNSHNTLQSTFIWWNRKFRHQRKEGKEKDERKKGFLLSISLVTIFSFVILFSPHPDRPIKQKRIKTLAIITYLVWCFAEWIAFIVCEMKCCGTFHDLPYSCCCCCYFVINACTA